MHSPVYLAICAASVGGKFVYGAPEVTSMVFASALAIAVLGVPHGGLDHWAGRRLFQSRFASGWWAVFFPTYLLVAIIFACGWFFAPVFTVVLFFLGSAWHFGREDQRAIDGNLKILPTNKAIKHVIAVSVGGLVIWIPALVRPDEMQSLLGLIVLTPNVESTIRIVYVTQMIAVYLVPLAFVVLIADLARSPYACGRCVPLVTAIIAFYMPILISFSIYFCGWHSWQGLRKLRHDEALTVRDFVRYVAPLSIAAVLGIVAAGWWLQVWSADSLNDGQSSATLRALFIGLSAIAVPHLLLHEIDSHRRTIPRVVTSKSANPMTESITVFEQPSIQRVCT
jgi:Brp/Blh family beta-carotene 15,15'-monooxygenase